MGKLVEIAIDKLREKNPRLTPRDFLSAEEEPSTTIRGILINNKMAAELTSYSERTLEAYRQRSEKGLTEGIHWQRGKKNSIQWSLEALEHWRGHLGDLEAHKRWCEQWVSGGVETTGDDLF